MDFSHSFGDSSWKDEKKNVSYSTIGDRLPIPVNISTLLAKTPPEEESLVYGNYFFSTVQVIGIVIKVAEDIDRTTYTLRDPEKPHCRINVIKFNTDASRNLFLDDMIVSGTTIRAIGKLKNIKEEGLSIYAFYISELEGNKQHEAFKLEAKVAELFFEKDVIDKMRRGELEHGNGMLALPLSRIILPDTYPFFQSDYQVKQERGMTQQSMSQFVTKSTSSTQQEYHSSNNIHHTYVGVRKKVYMTIFTESKSPKFEKGVPLNHIISKIGQCETGQLMKALSDIEGDGSIYTTENCHYLPI